MKPRNRNTELFGMSFLDIICCGFAAMVLLVLLAKTDIAAVALNTDTLRNVLSDITVGNQRKTSGAQQRATLTDQRHRLQSKLAELVAAEPNLANLNNRLIAERATAKRLRRQAARTAAAPSKKIVAVGGIPVTADHIIFIIDTSGSMQSIWSRVIAELENVLDIHPTVKGFQVMNDNGNYLIKNAAGRWIPDTPARRKSALGVLRNWHSVSNSSPVEGLQTALRTYAKRTEKLSIYIFGDDYTGGSYDPVLRTVDKLNRDPKTDSPLAQIHGIGFHHRPPFYDPGAAARFSTLMREVARRNHGAFIALSR